MKAAEMLDEMFDKWQIELKWKCSAKIANRDLC